MKTPTDGTLGAATRSTINDGAGGLRQLRRMLQSRDGSVFPDGGDHVEQARPDRLSGQRGSRGVYQEAGLNAFFIGESSQQSLGGVVCELVEGRESVRQLREQFFQRRIFLQILLDRRLVEFEAEVVNEIGASMFREICQRARPLANQAHSPLEPCPPPALVLVAPQAALLKLDFHHRE